MQAQNTAAGTTGLAGRHRPAAPTHVTLGDAWQAVTPRYEGDGVETMWRNRGDPMRIMALHARSARYKRSEHNAWILSLRQRMMAQPRVRKASRMSSRISQRIRAGGTSAARR